MTTIEGSLALGFGLVREGSLQPVTPYATGAKPVPSLDEINATLREILKP